MSGINPNRILVIDDEPELAACLKTHLELWGWEVLVAHSGETSLECAGRFTPGLVLCDIGLPRMDGFAVARALRGIPAMAGARLIAMSGFHFGPDDRDLAEAGFNLELLKPFNIEELRRAVLAGPRASWPRLKDSA